MEKLYQNKDWLGHQYWNLRKSTCIMGKMQSMNPGTIHYWLKKFSIPIRSISEGQKGKKLSKVHRKKMSKVLKGRHLSPSTEFKKGMKLSPETIEKMKGRVPWIKDKKLPKETRKKLSISHKGQKSWNKGKTTTEDLRILGGKNHYNWQGGIGNKPYPLEFDNKLKKQIKKRDNYTCQLCGTKERLAVHHIDYNKYNNNPENLLTLCIKCNAKVNYQRVFWTGFFMGRIYERQLSLFN